MKLMRQGSTAQKITIDSSAEIINYFKGRKVGKESEEYLLDHCKRYEFLLAEVKNFIVTNPPKKLRILDLGPSYQTEILRILYPAVTIDSVGFEDQRFQKRSKDKHFEFDLNSAQHPDQWLKLKDYDLIIMAELIEHLYTAPTLVLRMVSSWLKKKGALIIQTPNAISLNRRLKLLLGRHPYDMIRESTINPGHFREYTKEELVNAAKSAGLKLTSYTIDNYFRHKGSSGKAYNVFCKLLPEQLRDGLTLIFTKK